MIKLQVTPLHPREFKEIYQLTLYEMHRLSKYPQETLRHWLAKPESMRYSEPKDFVKHHFGILHLTLQTKNDN